MALTTSAVHSDVARGGGVTRRAALRSPQRAVQGDAALGGVTRGAALRSASPCWLVSAAVFL